MNSFRFPRITLCAFACAFAATTVAAVDFSQFPSELYPEIKDKTPDEITLAGIAALCPGRIIPAPATTAESKKIPAGLPLRKPLRVTLPGNIVYLCCYSLADFETIPADAPAIIDLRRFSTGPDALEACAAFCEKLVGVLPETVVVGTGSAGENCPAKNNAPARDKRKTFVLVNQSVAGPVEAMLADLQARGKIILAGTRTAGKTAFYAPFPNNEKYLRAVGELRPASTKQSLVGTGVTPEIRVAVSEVNDLYALQCIERDNSPENVRQHAAVSPENTEHSCDMILRRAYEVLVALQVTEGMAASAE